jgi:hypothetical protein
MENSNSGTGKVNTIDFENYDENYVYKLIELSFSYFDSHLEKESYEENVEIFIKEFSNDYKTFETKGNLKFLIDFIEKYYNADNNFIDENLKTTSMILYLLFMDEIK